MQANARYATCRLWMCREKPTAHFDGFEKGERMYSSAGKYIAAISINQLIK